MDPTLVVGDIVERDTHENKPVEFFSPSRSVDGFPKHKRRWRPSVPRHQRADSSALPEHPPTTLGNTESRTERNQVPSAQQSKSFEELEKRRIDDENRQKLAYMTSQEITQAQDDIMNGLNPALIKRLLQRANIEEPGSSPCPFDADQDAKHAAQPHTTPVSPNSREASEADGEGEGQKSKGTSKTARNSNDRHTQSAKKAIARDFDEDKAPAEIPADLFPISDLAKPTHFPAPPDLPDLDPSDPNFLSALHKKYFPNLPADPSKLAWMAPVPTTDSPADRDSPYYPHPEIALSALRFDFRGRFLSPRVSRSIPSTKGLHNHGEAPEAAGYTIAELAHLARSAVPAQRCIAFQTLGRIMYRLGRGEWGKTEDHPIAMGVWASIKKGRVFESLMEAAAGEGGHRGSRAYATEALWLFEKGGWKEKWQGR